MRRNSNPPLQVATELLPPPSPVQAPSSPQGWEAAPKLPGRGEPRHNLHSNIGMQFELVQIHDGTVMPVGPGQMLEHIVRPPPVLAADGADDREDDANVVGGILVPILIPMAACVSQHSSHARKGDDCSEPPASR